MCRRVQEHSCVGLFTHDMLTPVTGGPDKTGNVTEKYGLRLKKKKKEHEEVPDFPGRVSSVDVAN